jgi:protease secretion system membrane fusion protein
LNHIEITDDALEAASQKTIKGAMIVLGVGLLGFLIWASLVPLAEGVPTVGQVAIETRRKTVQHLQGGIVREVLVREGQNVSEGDLMLRLDPLTAQATFETARQELAGLKENLISQQAALKGFEQSEVSRLKQIELTSRELAGIKDLVQAGYAPQIQQMQLESSLLDQQVSVNDIRTSKQRTRQALLELEHQMVALRQKVNATQQDLSLMEIRAPVSGQVVGLQIQAVGGVVERAQRLLDIVPAQEQMLVETRVLPQYIDRVHAGQRVDVRFSSFANAPQLVVEGRLISVAKDVLTETNSQKSYYLARVEITSKGLQQLGSAVLQPGMPAETIIQTGERTVLQYLLHPFRRRLAASMTEA